MSRRRVPGRATSRNDRPIAFDVKPSEGLAVRAFHPDGFRRFAKLDEIIDEEDIRERFFEWLATTPEPEIKRFVAAMATFRQTLIDEGNAIDWGVDEPPILSASAAKDRALWRKIKESASNAAVDAERRARSAAAGKKGSKERVRKGEDTKAKALRLAKAYQAKVAPENPVCWTVAVGIYDDVDKGVDHVDRVLRALERAGEISFGKNRSA
jgi:hypothetical protein